LNRAVFAIGFAADTAGFLPITCLAIQEGIGETATM
jgi:hypothetical protein